MSKLPIVDSRRLEKVLYLPGFERVGRREATSFIVTGTAEQRPSLIIRDLARPLLREILRQIEVTKFVEHLHNV